LAFVDKTKVKINCCYYNRSWGYKMEYELEEVERDFIEFRKEIGEN
jgi:hypothetical protein